MKLHLSLPTQGDKMRPERVPTRNTVCFSTTGRQTLSCPILSDGVSNTAALFITSTRGRSSYPSTSALDAHCGNLATTNGPLRTICLPITWPYGSDSLVSGIVEISIFFATGLPFGPGVSHAVPFSRQFPLFLFKEVSSKLTPPSTDAQDHEGSL